MHARRPSFTSALAQYVEAFDLVYENQRRNANGQFTNQLLFQDPAQWSDEVGASVANDLESILVPAGWETVGSWIVDPEAIKQHVSNEQDGWQYAKAFAGSTWKPQMDSTCNVRRRPWIRKRRKRRDALRHNDLQRGGTTIGISSKKTKGAWDPMSSDLMSAIVKQRVDREKIEIVKIWLELQEKNGSARDEVVNRVMSILVQFDHECTKLDCLELLAPHLVNCQKPTSDAIIRSFIFFKDQKRVVQLLRRSLEPSKPHPVPLAFAEKHTQNAEPVKARPNSLAPGFPRVLTDAVLANDID
jgi:hypothetical protein